MSDENADADAASSVSAAIVAANLRSNFIVRLMRILVPTIVPNSLMGAKIDLQPPRGAAARETIAETSYAI